MTGNSSSGRQVIIPEDFFTWCMEHKGEYSLNELPSILYKQYKIEASYPLIRSRLMERGYTVDKEVARKKSLKALHEISEFFAKKEQLYKLRQEHYQKEAALKSTKELNHIQSRLQIKEYKNKPRWR